MCIKNEYCWKGCYDEKTEWMVLMERFCSSGEEVRYSCPKCGHGNEIYAGGDHASWNQHQLPPELEEKYGIDFLWGMKDKDDWTEENCIHCDGKGTIKKSRPTINHKSGIEFEVDCKHCEGRGKTTELRLKYCQAKIYDRDSGLSEPCTNEPAKICGGIWCGGSRWVCSRHWDDEAFSRAFDFWDGCCTTCADELSSFPSGH